MKISKLALLTFIAVWGAIGFCKEGFSSDPGSLPPSIARAWHSTFLILLDEPTIYEMGTAFLVKKIVGQEVTDLYFLASGHVLDKYCKRKMICANASLASNARLVHQSDGVHLQSLNGVFDKVEVLNLNLNPDLALLHVSVSSDTQGLPEPIPISPTCDMFNEEPLYSIGFSDPILRTSPGSLPIPEAEFIYKRWSQGIFTGYISSDKRNDENTHHWISTTVDMLEGGSGEPVLNSGGQVVGVSKNSASTKENQFRYDGNENRSSLDWESNAVRCGYLAKFIAEGIATR